MTALSVLSFNTIAPSLATIAVEFDATYAQVSFALSGFLAVNAALFLVLGPLSDRYGRRPVLLISVLIYIVASVGAALAQNLETFLTFRILQTTIAAGSVVSSAMVRDISGPDEAASRLGYLAMAMAIAPMLGPLIGGSLDQVLGWRATFWLFAALGAGLLVLSWADAGETNTRRQSRVAAQLRGYGDLISNTEFWAYTAVMVCGIGAFYVFIAGVPFVSAELFDLPPSLLGLGLGSITMGFFCGSFLSGRLSARLGLAGMIYWGRLLPVLGLGLGLLGHMFGLLGPALFFAAAITAGIGNGIATPSARAGSMSVRADLAGSASGLTGALILGVGAVLTQTTGALVSGGNSAALVLLLMWCLCAFALSVAIWLRKGGGL